MKLYYSAGSCSTSCHISLEESGFPYEAVPVDWSDAAQAAEVERLNPLGTLPILTDKNLTLNQNIGIHTYVADQVPQKQLLPPVGTPERAEAMSWLSFIASDLHKSFSPLFALVSVSPDKKVQEARPCLERGEREHLPVIFGNPSCGERLPHGQHIYRRGRLLFCRRQLDTVAGHFFGRRQA